MNTLCGQLLRIGPIPFYPEIPQDFLDGRFCSFTQQSKTETRESTTNYINLT